MLQCTSGGLQRQKKKRQTRDLAPEAKVLRCCEHHACNVGGGSTSMGGGTSLGGLTLVLTWLMASAGGGIHGGGVKAYVSSNLNHRLLQDYCIHSCIGNNFLYQNAASKVGVLPIHEAINFFSSNFKGEVVKGLVKYLKVRMLAEFPTLLFLSATRVNILVGIAIQNRKWSAFNASCKLKVVIYIVIEKVRA